MNPSNFFGELKRRNVQGRWPKGMKIVDFFWSF